MLDFSPLRLINADNVILQQPYQYAHHHMVQRYLAPTQALSMHGKNMFFTLHTSD